MKLNKKGSLELSVNAIVVLIIALTILGLVIAFAVSKFTEVSNQITPQGPPTATATAEIPVQFPGGSNEITLSKTADSTMSVSVYNKEATDLSAGTITVSCAGGGTFAFTAPTTTISSGKTAMVPIKMSAGSNAVGIYACNIVFGTTTTTVSAPILITVK